MTRNGLVWFHKWFIHMSPDTISSIPMEVCIQENTSTNSTILCPSILIPPWFSYCKELLVHLHRYIAFGLVQRIRKRSDTLDLDLDCNNYRERVTEHGF